MEIPADALALGFSNEGEMRIQPRPNEDEEFTLERERAIAAMTNPTTGLPDSMVEVRTAAFGLNELPEKSVHPLIKFLAYFLMPMPIMIWIAALVELVKAIITGDGWEDFVVLMILQIVNGTVGFVEERNAGNAIAALKAKLTPECYVCRGGVWSRLPSRMLIPGDLIELKIGDIVPADSMLLPGVPLQLDQSALTGESLPVTVAEGGKVKMGSAVKRGETKAVVTATGRYTFFGKAAELLSDVVSQSRFQKVIMKITLWLLGFSILLVIIIFIKLMVTDDNEVAIEASYKKRSKVLHAISTCVVLLVASIPIAIEVVCTTTMAMGSRRLAERKVIVACLSSIEELAGMSVLCSDKTGTLTQNKLSLSDPIIFSDITRDELVFYAALASKRGGGQDAIDYCIVKDLSPKNRQELDRHKELDFVPFNPTDKRTESTVQHPDARVFRVTKGAPQVILNMSFNREDVGGRVELAVQELADRGYRSLAVAVSWSPPDEPPKWELLGVLSVFDPPRRDAKHTIELARQNFVDVKMITGDQAAIAKETCRLLGMGTNVLTTNVLNGNFQHLGATLDEVILNANGFAEVYPEHKFQIVESLRAMGYVVGMTGDGVNDAPALKRADIGIAVEGATDAAKAAADIVLVEPGLSVIIEAIFRSRKIFQRMRNYCIYRVACTFQLLVFFFFAIITIDPSRNEFYGRAFGPTDACVLAHGSSFTLPVIALIVITILNDGTIITIAYDRVKPESRPQQWNLQEVTIVATVLGCVACLSSLIFVVIVMQARGSDFMAKVVHPNARTVNGNATCDNFRHVTWGETQTMVYLKISLSDFLTLFSSRTRSWFWVSRPSYALTVAMVVATGASTLLSLWWPFPAETAQSLNMHNIHNGYGALFTWIYVLVWFLAQDAAKVLTYWILDRIKFEDKNDAARREALAKISAAIESENKQVRRGSFNERRGSLFAKDLAGLIRTGSGTGSVIDHDRHSAIVPADDNRSVSMRGSAAFDAAAIIEELRYLRERVRHLESKMENVDRLMLEMSHDHDHDRDRDPDAAPGESKLEAGAGTA